MLAPLLAHVWISTLFLALLLGVVAVLRNRLTATARFALASIGILKFAIPGALFAPLLARPADAVATAMPERFSDVVLQRLAGLGPAAQRAVRAAAVLGPRFDWRLLENV